MKNHFLMITLLFCSLALSGQRYTKVLDLEMTAEDLDYMPVEELRLLKNELIATKGADIKSANEQLNASIITTSRPFLDSISESNVKLIIKLENNHSKDDSICSKQELYQRFLKTIEQQQKIPFYLQVLFLSTCQNPKANIYLVPASDEFYTLAISEKPMVGPEFHKVITMDKHGKHLDIKTMNGKARFENNTIIHESFNSLIEYTYTIDQNGNFDKKTPTKER